VTWGEGIDIHTPTLYHTFNANLVSVKITITRGDGDGENRVWPD
jgi:hypothetical protein